ncbi:MAG: DegT/DnrJ/EryC1/StrS family aminotransferase [Rhodothermales bacterium]|nr:DegT/DnrJ/EryC1/StrS family aminotransferase [Rhodothermales bacterium]
MDIQMVDLRGQYLRIKDEIDEAVQEVLDGAQFIRGPLVGEFECELAGHLGGKYALGVGNGTDALQIAMMALGVAPGDEVITTAFTFVATAEAAALLGAVPVFADIDPESFNIDPSAIEDLITPRTRAIVPVHLFGQPADLDPIMEIADRHGLPVIEDNAQGVGAAYKGRATGYIGTMGTLSFFPSKNLGAYGDGGAITTNDEALYEAARKVANHGGTRKYHNEIVGVNSRLDTLQAAILLVKLRHLEAFSVARRAAADRYDELLADVEGVTIPHRVPESSHVFHQYTIRVSPDVPEGRDGLAAHLKSAGIPHAVYYPTALHQLPVFKDGHAACRIGEMTHTETAAQEVISLPMHTELTGAQQGRVVDAIAEFVQTGQEAGA